MRWGTRPGSPKSYVRRCGPREEAGPPGVLGWALPPGAHSLCFSFRSRPRIHITGFGVGVAIASPNLPGSEQGAAGGSGECRRRLGSTESDRPTSVSCSHLSGAGGLRRKLLHSSVL